MSEFAFGSLLYADSLYFGGYPTKEWFQVLLEKNTYCFVDLTTEEEKIKYELYPYSMDIPSDRTYLNFPIHDNQIPDDVEDFKRFIHSLFLTLQNLKSGQKMYLHCKGGHGRSGMVAACLLCIILNIAPENALQLTTLSHSLRENLRAKWKMVRCPQTFRQRKFVMDVFRPVQVRPHYFLEKHVVEILNEPFKEVVLQKNSLREILDCFPKAKGKILIRKSPSSENLVSATL